MLLEDFMPEPCMSLKIVGLRATFEMVYPPKKVGHLGFR